LHNIENEVSESHKTIVALQAQASAAEEAKTNLQKMEESLVNRMSCRHKLGYAKWASDDVVAEPYAKDALYFEGGEEDCDSLRREIAQLQQRARGNFESFVKHHAEAGTGGRMTEYKRLIAAGCGTLSPADVDSVIDILLEVCVVLFGVIPSDVFTDHGDRRESAHCFVGRSQEINYTFIFVYS
jgi:transcription factor MBP1